MLKVHFCLTYILLSTYSTRGTGGSGDIVKHKLHKLLQKIHATIAKTLKTQDEFRLLSLIGNMLVRAS